MNYQHAFHAGSFADVHKHAVLTRILEHLRAKPAAFRVIDSHAGAGRYDLSGPEATRSGEWHAGIERVLRASQALRDGDARALLKPYLDIVAALNIGGDLRLYPGSPLIAKARLRQQDRLIACEIEPRATASLKIALRGDPRAKVLAIDGWMAVNANVPPKERRGLVLIDPSFEKPDELKHVEEALAGAIRKWPSGIYVAWRPIREAKTDARFLNAVAALGAPNILRLELDVGPGEAGAHGQEPLARAGLLVVNPPHMLFAEARALLPWLAALLARSGQGGHVCKWLTEPR